MGGVADVAETLVHAAPCPVVARCPVIVVFARVENHERDGAASLLAATR